MSDITMTDLNLLRDKTEETDMNCILKTRLGGYTKDSVMEYLAFVKTSQQSIRESHAQEIRNLQTEMANLQEKCGRWEEEKKKLLVEASAAQADLNEAMERIREGEKTLECTRVELADVREAAMAAEEREAELRRLLEEAEAKNEALAAHLEEIQNGAAVAAAEAVCLEPEPIPSVEYEESACRFSELIRLADELRSEMAEKTDALGSRIRSLNELTHKSMQRRYESMDRVQGELQDSLEQNEMLESEKTHLADRISELMEQNMTLGRENSHLKAEIAILHRKMTTV